MIDSNMVKYTIQDQLSFIGQMANVSPTSVFLIYGKRVARSESTVPIAIVKWQKMKRHRTGEQLVADHSNVVNRRHAERNAVN
jgi:hypothetical protein